jgi:hypothetical protein
MDHSIAAAVMLTEFMNLGVTIVTTGHTIIRSGGLNLNVFQPAEFQALPFVSGLQKTTAAAAAIVVGAVGLHIDKIFLPYDGFHHKPKIFGDRVAITFAYNLTGILDREFDFQILVPIRVHVEFSFPDPLGIVFIDVLDLKFMGNVEFFQSCQD